MGGERVDRQLPPFVPTVGELTEKWSNILHSSLRGDECGDRGIQRRQPRLHHQRQPRKSNLTVTRVSEVVQTIETRQHRHEGRRRGQCGLPLGLDRLQQHHSLTHTTQDREAMSQWVSLLHSERHSVRVALISGVFACDLIWDPICVCLCVLGCCLHGLWVCSPTFWPAPRPHRRALGRSAGQPARPAYETNPSQSIPSNTPLPTFPSKYCRKNRLERLGCHCPIGEVLTVGAEEGVHRLVSPYELFVGGRGEQSPSRRGWS